MSRNETQRRTLVLKIRINPQEQKLIEQHRQNSTEKTISNYIRKLAMQKPVTIRYRNESADDFLHEMMELKKQLNGIGNNFNQAVHKLHSLDRIPEFREWIQEQQHTHKHLSHSIDQIRNRINQLYEQWLQK